MVTCLIHLAKVYLPILNEKEEMIKLAYTYHHILTYLTLYINEGSSTEDNLCNDYYYSDAISQHINKINGN